MATENGGRPPLPDGLIGFGPEANCTLDICPIEWTVYQYRPSLPANSVFIAFFATGLLTHVYLGYRWRSWFYMTFMVLGCLFAIIGYAGRLMLYDNPFAFTGFLIQIVCITTAPVFYTAAIYVTLAKVINYFGPQLSRFNPKLFYWVFIPFDLVCLVLQAAGGAISTTSSGSSQAGVDIAMGGLVLQVIVLFAFCILLGDYLVRYFRQPTVTTLDNRLKLFFGFLAFAVILIFGRCIFRAYELSQGYQNSDLITDEALFIGLEGVLVVIATFSLCIGHPGFVFGKDSKAVAPSPPEPEADVEAKPASRSS
ncbi:hypothetical protein S7711_10188 [Stachybotrys chartarum IBT 7711]|uniref:Sphingoid long-chain base transporter RSB1 n=1 Tax=Stachybotrys chartarum (strain CBS 109288 / IBT 7711) TaxID=1280523 RepID=A0A084AUX6_STACB|nr:hypothetical protein S7711_10188 [Stachybotrys chartarum IBT 7711]KFA51970.1 hypothetical protein S40293_10204 [Stachybotrys chartarum IBT 40293]